MRACVSCGRTFTEQQYSLNQHGKRRSSCKQCEYFRNRRRHQNRNEITELMLRWNALELPSADE